MSASLAPQWIFQALTDAGKVADGALLYSYIAGGGTVPTPLIADDGVSPLANPLEFDAAGRAKFNLDDSKSYRLVLKDKNGVTLFDRDNVFSATSTTMGFVKSANLADQDDPAKGAGLVGYKGRTVADRLGEVVSVTDGPNAAKGDGSLEDIAGIEVKAAEASAAGKVLFFPAGTYLLPTGLEFDGTLFVEGAGDATILRVDGDVIKITNGPGSYVRNLRIEAVTVPTVVERTDANGDVQAPAMVLGGHGYQPSANDSDIWGGLPPAIQAQNVYCRITLDTCGAGFVENVSGEYALIEIVDGQDAHVSDCRIMGGKGQNGTIVIRNRATTIGYGNNNKALRNTVTYGTYSGIAFMGQKYPVAHGNTIFGVGESGIKTFQNTSGGEDARAYHATITKNTISRCYYDGIDGAMNFPAVSGTISKHRITHNTVDYCQHSGIWTDAEGATIGSNFIGRSYGRGIHLNQGRKCLVHDNILDDNNLDNSASNHHITDGGTSNEIHRNYIRCATATSKAIYVNPSKGASILDNTANGSSIQISTGNTYSGNKCLNPDSTSLQIGSILITDPGAETTGGYIGTDGILYRNVKHIRIHGTLSTAIGYKHIASNPRLTGVFTFACQDSSGGYYATIALSTINNVINSRSSVQVLSQNSWGISPCALDGTQWEVRSTAATRTTATLAFVTNRLLTAPTAYELNGIGNASYPTTDATDEVRAYGVGVFESGWAADTGTAKKTANATYSGTASAGYVQAEMQAVMDALRDATQTIKAIKDNRIARREIGA